MGRARRDYSRVVGLCPGMPQPKPETGPSPPSLAHAAAFSFTASKALPASVKSSSLACYGHLNRSSFARQCFPAQRGCSKRSHGGERLPRTERGHGKSSIRRQTAIETPREEEWLLGLRTRVAAAADGWSGRTLKQSRPGGRLRTKGSAPLCCI